MMVFKIYETLLDKFGEQGWWPLTPKGKTEAIYHSSFKRQSLTAREKFEVCVGAILTQNTSWQNVKKALTSLHQAGIMDSERMLAAPQAKLACLIKSSGYFRQKAIKLKAFCSHLNQEYSHNIFGLLNKEIKKLRLELLSLYGVGPETADSMILYAAQKPIFVVDAYTNRIGNRLGLFKTSDYHEIQSFFEKQYSRISAKARVPLYNEFHALLVALAKDFCKTKPMCAPCPLLKMCPTGKS